MKMTAMDKLNDVFRMVFDDETLSVSETTTANDVDGWDSLTHINLIMAVEALFRIQFSSKDLGSLRNVGDLLGIIESKGSA